jgi:hypothetical protein
MKRTLISIIILVIVASLFISCANERSIEQTINDFATASNNNDLSLLTGLLSPDSDFWAGGLGMPNVEALLAYMNSASPISFTIQTPSVNGNDATVNASAVYGFIGPTPFSVYFVMRLHDKEWKIRQYYDYVGDPDYVWLRLGRPEIVH